LDAGGTASRGRATVSSVPKLAGRPPAKPPAGKPARGKPGRLGKGKPAKLGRKPAAPPPAEPVDDLVEGAAPAPKPAAPRWAKWLIAVGSALVILSAGSVATAGALYHRWTSGIHKETLLPPGAGGQQGKEAIAGAFNLLMIGVDDRISNPGNGSRSDSIIIAHVNAAHTTVYLTSIPRDTLVEIPPFPAANYAGSGGKKRKINEAYQAGTGNGQSRSGGVQLLALTIEKLTGITFSGAAIVNFQGFRALVNDLGGVYMCIDEKTTSIHIGFKADGTTATPYTQVDTGSGTKLYRVPGVTPMVYEKGCRKLQAWQALDYVRQRDLLENGDGDYGRQRHQQQFISAVMKQAMAKGVLQNPVTLDAMIRHVGSALTVDLRGISLIDWMFTLRNVANKPPITLRTNAGKYDSLIINGAYQGEQLTADSMAMFEAVRTDTVEQFLLEHPDFASDAKLPTFR
jgi:LCP family protein required for cell wall assembly